MVKYIGSKNKIAKELIPIIQSYIKESTTAYIEPFVGGCNVIDKISHKLKIGCDNNRYLIALLHHVIQNKPIPEFITKDEYLNVKNNINNFDDWYVGLVGFCATYNSGWFRRYGAIAKTKTGLRNYYDESVRNIQKQSNNLKDVKLYTKDFRDVYYITLNNCVIYCDIPYNTEYEMYADSFPYEEFYEWAIKMGKNNVVLISEYNMPEDRFECVWSKRHETSLDNKDNKKARIEKLFIPRKGL